ncbi:hypothetical protein Tco_0860615 [Tanacetum coccineum]|uniref:Uncharacterized protein n=1 Tax=Tanacetum coccineum TaxID=301880 RepID=A0ABQ5BIH5_9ASTR
MKYHPQTHIPLRSNLGVLQIGIRANVIKNQIWSCRIQRIPQSPTRRYPVHLEAPPSPDYVSGPEYPPSPEFIPEPVYPEFMPPEDEVFLAKEQPLPAAVSPTTDLPGYIADSDPEEDEEDPEEDPKEDPKEDPIDYHVDGGDDDDDEDESSDDDDDDDDNVEEDEDEDEEEEEEHPAPADSVPPHVYYVTARMSIREQPPTPFWSEAEIARLLDIPSPPPSPPPTPLSSWSSPLP